MIKSAKPKGSPEQEPMFVTWEAGDEVAKGTALVKAGSAINSIEPVVRTLATDVYRDAGGRDQHIRDSFGKGDYNEYRRSQAIDESPRGSMAACMKAYKRVGIVRNVIDLMADFATQGIDIYHPNERIEKFFKEWFRRVRGPDRSERFMNYLYRIGNVVVRRSTAKLPIRLEDEMRRAQSEADIKIEPPVKVSNRELPWKYTFINPLTVDVIDDDLSLFVTGENLVLGVTLPSTLINKIKNPKNARQRELVKQLPADLVQSIINGEKQIPLDMTKVCTSYYKRDDWESWAKPMVFPILSDLQILEKMKLADLAALDGAISCIRVWKLGNIEARILPTAAAINKLSSMLMNNVGGGVMDLVWGPELELIETSTEVHRFLGSTKYEPCLTQIYAGLGIPPTLTGASNSSGGFTNNFISLKTLTERLEYGRSKLAEFWQAEIRLVQQAMGFRLPAQIVFDRMTLSDEAAEKKLLLDLWDRGLVSDEIIVERFGEVPDVEEARVRRDEKKRRNGSKPPKASPYHDPQVKEAYAKIFATQGAVTPSQLGVELEENKNGEVTVIEQNAKLAEKTAKVQQSTPIKVGSAGRPKNSKDGKKRKQKVVKPRSAASFIESFAWVQNAQAKINAIASPAYLKSLGKKTLRELSDEEASDFEQYKFFLLCQIQADEVVTESVVARLSRNNLEAPTQVVKLLEATVAKHSKKHGKSPSVDVLRNYQAAAIAAWRMPV